MHKYVSNEDRNMSVSDYTSCQNKNAVVLENRGSEWCGEWLQDVDWLPELSYQVVGLLSASTAYIRLMSDFV